MNHVRKGRRRPPAGRAAGYTVGELVIVLAIVGVLVGVIVFSLRGLDDNGRENSCRNEKRQVQDAVQGFFDRSQRYPVDVRELLRNPVTGKGFLDRTPRWYRAVAPDGTVRDPDPAGRCAGI